MNTHPHLDTGHQARLAGTLRSLSLAPVPSDIKPPKYNFRRLILTLGLGALVCGAAGGLVLLRTGMPRVAPDSTEGVARKSLSGHETGRPPVISPVPVVREITGSGFVVAPRTTTVFPKYAGRITHIAVEAGDRVEAGQILATLDDASARFALEQAQSAYALAELVLDEKNIDLAQAGAALRRTEALAVNDAVSRQMLEEVRTAQERSVNAVAQARQNLARASLAVRIAGEPVTELSVRAPFSGTVTRLDAHVGDTVLARADSVRERQGLLTITDMTLLVIDADFAETNMAALAPGLRGEAVLDGFPGRPFPVEVLRIAPVASAEKGTIALRLSLTDPPAGIRPNMAARIRILLNKAGDMTQ